MSDTLLLDTVSWDLTVDILGNIAVASDPYALAQDAASAIRLFRGELYYNTKAGVQYNLVLGKSPPLSLLKATFEAAALTVPGVKSATCFFSGVFGRTLTGQVQITDKSGQTATAAF